MTLVSDLIHRTRRHFYTETRDEMDRLTSTINSSVTTIGTDFSRTGIQAGSVLSIDLEDMLVWSVSGSTITVQRGFNGTTAAAHTSGDVVRVNAKITDAAVLQAINDDLTDLSTPSNGLYAEATVALTFQAGTYQYDLTGVTDLIGILEVKFEANDGSSSWPPIPPSRWTLQRGLSTSDFPSGMALRLAAEAGPDRPLRVTYAKPFTALTSTSQNVETIAGLPATAHDIPPMGAAMRLSDGGEIAREFLTQGDTRRADEVPPQARAVAGRALAQRRRERIEAERSRLYKKWPTVTR